MDASLGEKLKPKKSLIAVLIMNALVALLTWGQTVLAFQLAQRLRSGYTWHWVMFFFASLLTLGAALMAVMVFGRALWVSQDAVTSTLMGKPWKQVRFDDLRQVKIKTHLGSPIVVVDLMSLDATGAMRRWRINGGEWVSLTPFLQRVGVELQRRPELLSTAEDFNNWRMAMSRS